MNKIILTIIAILIVILVGCTEYTTTPEIYSCEKYCKQEGYNSGNCFDCIYLEGIELPTECNSDKFFYDENINFLCNKNLKDNIQHGCLCE
jgi:hypothetical protein